MSTAFVSYLWKKGQLDWLLIFMGVTKMAKLKPMQILWRNINNGGRQESLLPQLCTQLDTVYLPYMLQWDNINSEFIKHISTVQDAITNCISQNILFLAHSMLYLSDMSGAGRQMLQATHVILISPEPACATASHLFSGLSDLPSLLRPALWRMVAAVACHPVNKYHTSSCTFLYSLHTIV